MSELNHFNAKDFAPAEILESTDPVGYWGNARLKPGVDAAEVEKTMRVVMDTAREEPGYELYAIYHSPDEVGSYRISERWATGEDLRKHIENPALYPYLGRFAETLDFSDAQWVRAVV
ncbi:putative quinol monooxygenase [Plantactinospora sp. WMMB334]|uniref:putative quinol monooxygenase n=1 Tax=Plantactinospora sp. WMMB334 TaxID=3404119 RepID=UPI003B947E46